MINKHILHCFFNILLKRFEYSVFMLCFNNQNKMNFNAPELMQILQSEWLYEFAVFTINIVMLWS